MKTGTIARGLGAAILAAALAGPSAWAATANITAQVQRVMILGGATWGGCMASLSVNPRNVLPLCGSTWVTFSCTGNFTDAIRAYRMLDQAQLALATNKSVQVTIDDTRRHNGYCFAQRIDVIK